MYVYEELLTVPDFSIPYHNTIRELYGVSQQEFDRFRGDLQRLRGAGPEMLKCEEQLLTHIRQHKEEQLLTLAKVEAANRNGHLIYRHYEGEYGLDPEKMRQQHGTPILSRLEIKILEPASEGNGDERKDTIEQKKEHKKHKLRRKGKRK